MDSCMISAIISLLCAFLICCLMYHGYQLKEKSLNDKRYCKAKTTGTVVGYEKTTRFGVNLPIIKYYVGNKPYKAIGPKYEFIIQNKFQIPACDDQDVYLKSDLKDKVFEYNRSSGMLINEKINPMERVFPIGSKIDVFYDRFEPDNGCVLRYVDYTKSYRYICYFWAAILCICLIGSIHVMISYMV